MFVFSQVRLSEYAFTKLRTKVQKKIDICKFMTLVLTKKSHQILCKYNRKVPFVQMVLNDRKSIFELCREKFSTFGHVS